MRALIILMMPLLAYFITLFWVGVMVSWHGHSWIKDKEHVTQEYLIILAAAYALYLLIQIKNLTFKKK